MFCLFEILFCSECITVQFLQLVDVSTVLKQGGLYSRVQHGTGYSQLHTCHLLKYVFECMYDEYIRWFVLDQMYSVKCSELAQFSLFAASEWRHIWKEVQLTLFALINYRSIIIRKDNTCYNVCKECGVLGCDVNRAMSSLLFIGVEKRRTLHWTLANFQCSLKRWKAIFPWEH